MIGDFTNMLRPVSINAEVCGAADDGASNEPIKFIFWLDRKSPASNLSSAFMGDNNC